MEKGEIIKKIKNIINANGIQWNWEDEEMILDVGCGLTPVGDVNLDREIHSSETGRQTRLGLPIEERQSFKTCLDIRASGNAIPFQDNSFSVVWSSDSIEHSDNPAQFLEECIRVSRSLVIIETPHYWDKDSKIPYHRSRFKRRDFERMLRASQYQIAWRYHTTIGYLSQQIKIPLFRPRKIILHIFKNPKVGPFNTFMGVNMKQAEPLLEKYQLKHNPDERSHAYNLNPRKI